MLFPYCEIFLTSPPVTAVKGSLTRSRLLEHRPEKIVSCSHVCHFSTATSSKPVSPFASGRLDEQKLRQVGRPHPGLPKPSFSEQAVKDAFNHCVNLVKTRDFSNYLAALLMPSAAQPAVFALLALNVELAVVRDQIKRNAGTAGIYRLQFWKDALGAIYGGGNGPVPRQPVATALTIFAKAADASLLNELVSSRQSTLGDRPFATVEKLEEYGRRSNGTLMKLIMNELWGAARVNDIGVDEGLQKGHIAAELMGAAVGIITLLRSAVPMMSRGIVLLPDDLMNLHALTADQFYNNKRPEAAHRVVKDLIQNAVQNLSQSRNLRGEIPANLRRALVANGATMDFLLKVLQKNSFNLYDARLQRSYDLLAWRLWWRCLVGRY